MLIQTGGGRFDIEKRGVYFLACSSGNLEPALRGCKWLLIALDQVKTKSEQRIAELVFATDANVFLDSGVFGLASGFAAKTGISHDEALRTPLKDMPGYDAHRKKYIEVVRKYESLLWGYVELDLGGTDQKIETRAGLEAEGLRPIPVYHPLGDGWDYFDYLAERYDRICVGNIVRASNYVRERIFRTIWERKKKYPRLWTHFLGMTNSLLNWAYPIDSMDSSTWCGGMRWMGAWAEYAAAKRCGYFGREFYYKKGNFNQWKHMATVLAFCFSMNNNNLRHHLVGLGVEGSYPQMDPI